MYKLLQINIEHGGLDKSGRHTELGMLPEIVKYIQAENFDLITMQELGGYGYAHNKNPNLDCFKFFLERLPDFKGKLFKLLEFTDLPKGYHGIAVFYNQNFSLEQASTFFMHKTLKKKSDYNWSNGPWGSIKLKLKAIKEQKIFNLISAHFTVGPIEYIESKTQIERAALLVTRLKKLKDPLILAADFNLNWGMKTVTQFEAINLRNLAREFKIKNTINPLRTRHYENIFIKDKISVLKGGVACDNILISRDSIKPISFEVSKADLSDHFGLKLDFDFL